MHSTREHTHTHATLMTFFSPRELDLTNYHINHKRCLCKITTRPYVKHTQNTHNRLPNAINDATGPHPFSSTNGSCQS